MSDHLQAVPALEPLPPISRDAIDAAKPTLALLSVVTLKDTQYNFRVIPEDALAAIEIWENAARDEVAAIGFWAQSIDGRGYIGRWTFATAMIGSMRLYGEAELAEIRARADAAKAATARAR